MQQLIDYPSHDDIKSLTIVELEFLCERLRKEIIETVARQGGHLASSLGAVELCVALHRCFQLDGQDALFFDVGHQSYAHKLLSGRSVSFARLRQGDGCSGFPSPAESPFDPVVAGHAGVAISQALGASRAMALRGEKGRSIAVVGDGALGCGIAWEGLDNLPVDGERLVIILNDNQMSISPNHGAFRRSLNRFIAGRFYNRIRDVISGGIGETRGIFYKLLRKLEHATKALVLPQGVLFQELGCRYIGPIDGNDIGELCRILPKLPTGKPVLLHVVTRKGAGYGPAEDNPEAFHGVPGFDIATGELKGCAAKQAATAPSPAAVQPSYSQACADALCEMASENPEVVVISAAMLGGTGLKHFAELFPKRCYDVGIAESHAVAFASGLAARGMRPVVAMYSTFLQRALDNVYHDVCLNNLPVIFCIDRTGAVQDGPTHHGIYALPFLRQLPNLTIMAPADAAEMTQMLQFAWQLKSPVVLRYPRSRCIETLQECAEPRPPLQLGKCQVLDASAITQRPALTIWAAGAEVARASQVAKLLEKWHADWQIRVVNARFLLPFDAEAARLFAADSPQAVIDDYTPGGLLQCLQEALAGIPSPLAALWCYTWPKNQILAHGTDAEMRQRCHLTTAEIAADLEARLLGHGV